MIFAGVDVGFTGGIVFMNDRYNIVSYFKTPIYTDNKKRYYDLKKLRSIFYDSEYCASLVFIEQSNSRPGQSSVAGFTFGKGYGKIMGLLAGLQIPYKIVNPARWKKYYGLDRHKINTINMVNKLYKLDLKPKDDGIADATMIAKYGIEQFNKEKNGTTII